MSKLNKKEEELLRLFQKRVQDLRECGLIKQGSVTLRVNLPLGGTVDSDEIPFEGFDRDHFRSAMQTLRQFILNNDAVNLNKICKLIRRRCDRQELVEWSEYARSIWKKTMKTAPLCFHVGSKLYDVKAAIDLLLYSFLSHTDIEKAKEWEQLTPGAKATIYFIVQDALLDLFYCLHIVDSIIMYWLDKPEADIPKLGDVKARKSRR
ncbi:MAG TPA: hypothetical protein VIH42_06315 [Thermoguttaceae bacterium]